jgi:hypothetical protein
MSLSAGVTSSLGTRAATRELRSDSIFFSGMAILLTITVFAGFARTYYLAAFTGAPPVSFLVHLHAIVFTGWMLLFVVQTALVAANRTLIHRRLGVLGGFLAALMLVLGVATSLAAAKRGYLGTPPIFKSAMDFLAFSLGHLLVFVSFVAAALYYRNRPDTHKRLMLLGVCGGLLIPPLGRLPLVLGHTPAILSLLFAFLLAGPIYDRFAHGRINAAYKWGVPLIVLSLPARIAFASTPAWRNLAAWLVR